MLLSLRPVLIFGLLLGCGGEEKKTTIVATSPASSPMILTQTISLDPGNEICQTGGRQVKFFSDLDQSKTITDGDSFLSSLEVCNGEQGEAGANGLPGANGVPGANGGETFRVAAGLELAAGRQICHDMMWGLFHYWPHDPDECSFMFVQNVCYKIQYDPSGYCYFSAEPNPT